MISEGQARNRLPKRGHIFCCSHSNLSQINTIGLNCSIRRQEEPVTEFRTKINSLTNKNRIKLWMRHVYWDRFQIAKAPNKFEPAKNTTIKHRLRNLPPKLQSYRCVRLQHFYVLRYITRQTQWPYTYDWWPQKMGINADPESSM